jgi:type IV pilus assembly protein PilE
MRMAPTSRHASRGYTLMELMITVAIVAILASIATAAYTSQVQKSRRTDARSALLDLAGREEKLFSTSNAYSQLPSDLGYGAVGATWPITVGSGYYQVTVYAPDTVNQGGAAGTYYIVAVPVPTSPQAGDTTCTQLAVNQLGAQTATPTANASTCWSN